MQTSIWPSLRARTLYTAQVPGPKEGSVHVPLVTALPMGSGSGSWINRLMGPCGGVRIAQGPFDVTTAITISQPRDARLAPAALQLHYRNSTFPRVARTHMGEEKEGNVVMAE